MRQVAKVDIRESFAELREDGETISRRSTDERWKCGFDTHRDEVSTQSSTGDARTTKLVVALVRESIFQLRSGGW